MRFINNGESFRVFHYIIEKGLNSMPNDFKKMLEGDKVEFAKWNKLIEKGSIKVL